MKSTKMYDDANPAASPNSLKHKLKKFSCCFRRDSPSPPADNPALIWVRTTEPPRDHSLSEIKEKCCAMLGISGGIRHKRSSSAAEFSYDPLSYAMNFEDGFDFDGEAPLKNFSARLPPPTTVN